MARNIEGYRLEWRRKPNGSIEAGAFCTDPLSPDVVAIVDADGCSTWDMRRVTPGKLGRLVRVMYAMELEALRLARNGE